MSATIQFTPIATAASPAASGTVLRLSQAEPLLSRTFYQDGRLLTAADLNRDYGYLDRRLRDLGLVMGDGVVRGLALTLAGSVLTAAPGSAVAASGRTIAADTPISADLADIGTLATLNGAGASIANGLYAVLLLHGEQPTGIAEIFPRDLSRRRTGTDAIVDTVELALLRLPNGLPGGSGLHARGQLAPSLAYAQTVAALPADSVALGVVAMQAGLPSWLDSAMLRHRLRAADTATAASDDLTAHWAALFADITASLGAGIAFRAADYLTLLPPAGLLPRGAVDPATATQTFFPAQIDVAITPARMDEIADILLQARGEPAIDLTAGTPAQVQILVPLQPADYAALAPALLSATAAPTPSAFKPYPIFQLPRIDPLLLRLPGRRPPPITPQDAWTQIWTLAPAALPWMVRPTDGGIGGVSTGLLAAGYAIPAPPPPVAATPVAATPVQPPAASTATDTTAPPVSSATTNDPTSAPTSAATSTATSDPTSATTTAGSGADTVAPGESGSVVGGGSAVSIGGAAATTTTSAGPNDPVGSGAATSSAVTQPVSSGLASGGVVSGITSGVTSVHIPVSGIVVHPISAIPIQPGTPIRNLE